MDPPTSLRVVGPQGCSSFKASIGKLDIYDNPYCCRGMTHSGYRCSRNIAASHVPKLPAFSLKGIVAYYKPKNSYGNCLAAYYCWQHTSQATFTKRSSTIVVEEERQPLAEKSRNVVVKADRAIMPSKLKVEEIETESAQSSCRASTRNPRPAQIKIATPKILDVETLSPTVISPTRKLLVFRDDDPEAVKAAPQTEKTETSTSTTVRRKTTELAELKAVNVTLQAAVQQLTSNEESKSAEMKELKAANAALLAAVQALTGQVEGLKGQMVRMEEERMVAVDVGVVKSAKGSDGESAGAGGQTAAAGYYQQQEKMGLDKVKEPLICVQPLDLETGLQGSVRTRMGLWQRVRRAFCLCA